MRSYGEFCALARALDVVGDRWTLLIIRELAARPCRFRDLSEGLPGIAANLLAERLHLLQAEGVITHDQAATYRLTDRGKALGPALKALARWGVPLMARGRGPDEHRAHWLALAIGAVFEDARVKPTARIQVLTDDGEIEIVAHRDGVEARPGRAISPDATLKGPDELILGALTGEISIADAEKAGLEVNGSHPALRRLISARRRPAAT